VKEIERERMCEEREGEWIEMVTPAKKKLFFFSLDLKNEIGLLLQTNNHTVKKQNFSETSLQRQCHL
jgi:hypothetical protein